MRMILMTAASALLVAGLAGCNRDAPTNQPGQASRNASAPLIDRGGIRELLLIGCRNGDPNAARQLTQAGINVEQFCICAVDRYVQGASDAEIQQISTNPNQARLQQASEQCVAEMTGRSRGAPSGNTTSALDAATGDAANAADAAAADVERAVGR
ncbi:MAG TPA: hypothetical protein VMG08_07015 [Allosphingosinicella sp.]|nr:hypothetical protein [Allosphingosinicella sp.]